MTLVLVCALGYGLLPRSVGLLHPQACGEWSTREVGARELAPEDLVTMRRETRLVRVPSYMAAWPRDGISLPGVVAVSDRAVWTGNDLLWHELVHQYQYRADGELRFMVRYLVDWHRGLLAGCGFDEAYMAIGYELETEEILRRMRQDLGGVRSDAFARIEVMLVDPSVRLPPPQARSSLGVPRVVSEPSGFYSRLPVPASK